MAKLTGEQITFLKNYNIPLEKVFDATGLKKSQYKERMKILGMEIAYGVTPCEAFGHTLRRRHGDCVQCRPDGLSYARRHSVVGEVYVVYSAKAKLVKVGSTEDVSERIITLNKRKYGGAGDWEKKFAVRCSISGKIEFKAHQFLAQYSIVLSDEFGDYKELFNCDPQIAIQAVKSVVAKNS